jgi:hypothetical protein
VYLSTNEWIRFADTKAGSILAVEGIIAGVVYSNLNTIRDQVNQHPLFLYCLLASIVTGSISFYFSVRCLLPTTHVGDTNSVIFFGQIARRYDSVSSYERGIKNFLANDDHLQGQLTQQIWANSHIAARKFAMVNKSIMFFTLAILFGALGVIIVTIL